MNSMIYRRERKVYRWKKWQGIVVYPSIKIWHPLAPNQWLHRKPEYNRNYKMRL